MTDVRTSGDELITDAVRLLTRAARHSADSSHALDFAGLLAHVLAATANVGGRERLLAARPGPWEASHLHALTDHHADALTVALWHAAHDSVPLPMVDAQLSRTTDHPTAREE